MPSPSFTPPGVVYLVGAGPGAPDLITVRGLTLLRRAGAVIYDALLDPALLNEAPANAERIFAGKRAGRHALPQEEINELLRRKAHEHAVVVRLKGGDPFVFGRGGEELAYLLAAGVSVEVVPGVTSAIAAASVVSVPLTQRQVSNNFAVVSGSSSPDAVDEPPWHALAQIDTLVILMGLKKIGQVTQHLIDAGRAPHTPAMIVCSATLPDQQCVMGSLDTLEQLATALTGDGPATIVVGEVVRLARTPLHSGRETA
jgi:uroporphyrin-III C-methyltransferase